MYEPTGQTEGSQPLLKVLPTPVPFVKIIVEIQIGFQLIKVEMTEDCLASCDHDKHANTIRLSEAAVFEAFKTILLPCSAKHLDKPENKHAHQLASTN